ncbi:MAG: PEGA domain-containing protein [Kofleriaceae bacterium]
MPARATRTQLMISSQQDGARGRVDDVAGPLPLTVEVSPGEHEVVVEADGFQPRTQRATAVEGEFIVVEVELAPRPALLDIATEAGATLVVDGRAAGATPLATPVSLPAGPHRVAVLRRGRQAWTADVELTRGQELTITAALRPSGQRRAVPWVLGGAGVLALGAGAAALVALDAQGQAQAIDDRRGAGSITVDDLASYDDARARRDGAARAGWLLGGAAVTTAAIGLFMYIFDRPSAEAGPALTPMVTSDGAGLALGGAL